MHLLARLFSQRVRETFFKVESKFPYHLDATFFLFVKKFWISKHNNDFKSWNKREIDTECLCSEREEIGNLKEFEFLDIIKTEIDLKILKFNFCFASDCSSVDYQSHIVHSKQREKNQVYQSSSHLNDILNPICIVAIFIVNINSRIIISIVISLSKYVRFPFELTDDLRLSWQNEKLIYEANRRLILFRNSPFRTSSRKSNRFCFHDIWLLFLWAMNEPEITTFTSSDTQTFKSRRAS